MGDLPTVDDRYELLERLHSGGMGTVWRVRHRLLDEERVIKVLHAGLGGNAEFEARFMREARAASRLHHPNIARVFDFTIDAGRGAQMVLELIDGVDLARMLKESGPPSAAMCVEIAQQALAAIGHLHSKGMIHRDVSPDNFMLSRADSGQPLVTLIDLGVVKLLDGDVALTAEHAFVGKLLYAAPECYEADLPVDPRADLYSFGVLAYELLTGTHPFRRKDAAAVIRAHLEEPPLSFDVSDPQGRVSAELRAALLRAMAKSPDERWHTADELASALSAAAADMREPGSAELDRLLPIGVASAQAAPRDPTAATPISRVAGLTEGLEDMLAGIRRLAELEQLREAELQLNALQRMDPVNPAITALADELAGRRAAHQQATLDRAEVSFEERLRAGDIAGARQLVGGLERHIQEDPRVHGMRAQVGGGEPGDVQRSVSDRLAELLAQASAELEAGASNAAEMTVRLALDLDPENVQALELLRLIRGEPGRGEEVVQELRTTVRELIDGDRLDQAAEVLETAEREHGAAAFVAERERLDATQRASRLRIVRERLGRARRAAKRGELARAFQEIRAAGNLSPGDPEVQETLHDAMERQAVATVRSYLNAGDVPEAGRALALAEKMYGAFDELDDLRRELDELRRSSTTVSVQALLVSARQLIDTGDVRSALQELRRAGMLAPDHPGIQPLMESAMAAHAEATVRAYVAKGQSAEARRALELAEKLLGDRDAFAELKQLVGS
jgi:serine/threonine-protein kinase